MGDSDEGSDSDDGSTVDIAKYAMGKAEDKNNKVDEMIKKNEKVAAKVMKAAKATEDKADKTAKPTAVKATAVGPMPAKVAGKLQTQVSKVTDAEQSDSKKARILCHMAR